MAAGFGAAGQLGQTWRDADGRVHYADGSVGPAVAAWNDGGNWTYAKNADVQGDIFREQGMTPPGQGSVNNTKPLQVGGGLPSASPAGSISSYTAGQNPYLQQMGDALVQQNTQNLQRNVLPQVGSAAMAAGGYGGSRQGVVESNAISDLNTANANGLASLYGGAYNTNLQYDLGRRSQDQSYDLGRRNNDLGYFSAANSYNLGMGNLGLGYAGLDRQIANDNMSWGQQGYNNNMGLWGQLMNNNQIGLGAGQGINNTPINYWQQFGNQYNSIGQGYGTQTQSGGGGNPIMGALGGAQLGSQVANWWNGGGSGNATTATGYGNGTMSDLQGYGVF